jgi:hypothetical protein
MPVGGGGFHEVVEELVKINNCGKAIVKKSRCSSNVR